jgi:nucleoside-diphosphate-sugar epimerase
LARTALVTGAYGYLGSLIRTRLEEAGWMTSALARTPRSGDSAARWSLDAPPPEDLLGSCDALVHCAYDFEPRSREDVWAVNVAGSVQLLDAATKAGVARILVVSSMSAYEGTGQIYGQAKLAIERATLDAGGVAIRPGLVWGDDPRGMAGTLRRLTKLPLLPDLGPGARQFPVHEDDLARTVVEILASPGWTSEVFGVAQPRAVDFRSVLLALADDDGRRHRFVRVPWQALYGVLAVAEKLRVSPVRADSILGLVRPAPDVPASVAFPDLGTKMRELGPATEALQSGRAA